MDLPRCALPKARRQGDTLDAGSEAQDVSSTFSWEWLRRGLSAQMRGERSGMGLSASQVFRPPVFRSGHEDEVWVSRTLESLSR